MGAGLALKIFTSKWTWLAVAITVAYGYYSWSQLEIRTLHNNIAVEELVRKHQEAAMKTLREDVRMKDQAQQRMAVKEKLYQSSIDALSTKLTESKNKQPRVITKLAKAKPKMMAKIITRGAKFRNRCFEIATGSLITQEELNVKKKDRNNVCPELYAYEN